MRIGKIIEYGICNTQIRFPNVEITKDRHVKTFEFELMISGNGTSFINDKSCDICPGLVLLRKPGSISHSKLHFKAFYFYLDVDENSEYYNKLLAFPNYFFSANKEEYHAIFDSLFSLFARFGTDENNDLINAELVKLFYFMERDKNQKVSPQSLLKAYATVQPSLDFINENFSEQITLDDIAKASGYSQFYFQKKFVEIMGVSPQKYLVDTRIAHAKKLLVDPQKSLVNIAYECGFPSQSYFCYTFKKNTNLTPTEYKKRIESNYLI
jgi:AraC-like DNA-binding protein